MGTRQRAGNQKERPSRPMKKNLITALLALGLMGSLVALEALVFSGLLKLLGFQYRSLGWLVLYLLVSAALGLPLELFTNGLARALYRLGKATRRQANLLFIPLDTLCSCFIFWLVDACMDAVTATGLSILVLALLFALLSQPIGKKEKPGGDGGTP